MSYLTDLKPDSKLFFLYGRFASLKEMRIFAQTKKNDRF